MSKTGSCLHLRLPATSANLGPAFDTGALALKMHLEIEAEAADRFGIVAEGRDTEACGKLEGNLVLDTYKRLMEENGRPIQPLHLRVKNGIPLGMGCGSSAAARLAGIALAVEFGELGWQEPEILNAAAFLEGHPDNATACWLGGMTVSAIAPRAATEHGEKPKGYPSVAVGRIEIPEQWSAVMVLPRDPVRTEESRKLLPDFYSRADVVQNLQHSSLLVAAFASGRDDLLRAAMVDCMHQPYRVAICPLLATMLPLAGSPGILGAALSGAGPGILLVVERNLDRAALERRIGEALGDRSSCEVIPCGFESQGADSMACRDTPLNAGGGPR
ncbi:MAG TPA: homoserine kinase [Acidobacteriaceae bacterium]|nr:homoserine kinase [Acidobacteriaceae bacterium]